MVSQLKVNEIVKQSGSSITIGETGDTVSGPFTNVPAFYARASAQQSLSNNTLVKLQLDTEDYDTNNDYDNSTNYRFTPSVAGKYWLFGSTNVGTGVINTFAQILIYKNGSAHRINLHRFAGDGDVVPTVCGLVEANGSSDYFELYVKQNTGSSRTTFTDNTWFGGYRVIGA